MPVEPWPAGDEFDYDDWAEVLAAGKPGGDAGFALEASQDSIVITLPANKVRAAIPHILGYSVADTAAPWLLRRPAVPAAHPRFPHLWADGVSVRLTNPVSNKSVAYDLTERYPGTTRTDALYKAKEDAVVTGTGYGPDYRARYARAELTVRFSEVSYPILRNGDQSWDEGYGPDSEWKRFFGFHEFDPTLDLITAEGGTDEASFYFAETDDPAADGPTAGSAGSAFNGSVYVRKQQSNFTFLWKNVAEDYTSVGGPLCPQPKRLLAALGCVNDDWFPQAEADGGFAPGTLLFAGVKGKRYQQYLNTNEDFGIWAWDWYLTFAHFDPERPTAVKDSAGAAIAEATRKRGHLLFPWRQSRKWYYASAGTNVTRGTYSGRPALREVDFFNLFRHVKNTTYTTP